MVWDEETIRSLRDLWAQGLSTAEIGRRLSVSKNAIVGKAHRLDLDARPSPIRRDAAKPATERAAPLPRMAGPTLPPLASSGVEVYPSPAVDQPAVAAPPIVTPAVLESIEVSPSNVQPLRPAPVIAMRPVALPPPAPVITPSPRVSLPSMPIQTRRSTPSCCWPIGEPGTKAFRFCDDASLPGKPYCDEHAKLAYVRIRDRKEDAA